MCGRPFSEWGWEAGGVANIPPGWLSVLLGVFGVVGVVCFLLGAALGNEMVGCGFCGWGGTIWKLLLTRERRSEVAFLAVGGERLNSVWLYTGKEEMGEMLTGSV